MQFIKSEDLRAGMRLAKPIYNKTGVLLYDRNSKLTATAINSITNFGIFGIYILEPAEPIPPLSEEDLKFEQLQTIYMFKLRDILNLIYKRQPLEDSLDDLIDDILNHYGALNHRVNFNQNLRSAEDFIFKHAISTSILVAMMTSRFPMSYTKKKALLAAALLYDIGYRYVPKTIIEKGTNLSEEDEKVIQESLERGLNYLTMYQHDFEYMSQAVALAAAFVYSNNPARKVAPSDDIQRMLLILAISDRFDQMTAMNLGHEPESEIAAMRKLVKQSDIFPATYVKALSECIHIVPHAASVDLSTGDKGIVLIENPEDYMHPVILRLSNNMIYDLSNPTIALHVQILDIMKTMDNRILVDEKTIKQFVPDERLKELTQKLREKLGQVSVHEIAN